MPTNQKWNNKISCYAIENQVSITVLASADRFDIVYQRRFYFHVPSVFQKYQRFVPQDVRPNN